MNLKLAIMFRSKQKLTELFPKPINIVLYPCSWKIERIVDERTVACVKCIPINIQNWKMCVRSGIGRKGNSWKIKELIIDENISI